MNADDEGSIFEQQMESLHRDVGNTARGFEAKSTHGEHEGRSEVLTEGEAKKYK